jgi:hypothetical protein
LGTHRISHLGQRKEQVIDLGRCVDFASVDPEISLVTTRAAEVALCHPSTEVNGAESV